MTDPVYGDTPIDGGEIWDNSFPVPLAADPYWLGWRAVWDGAIDELAQSQWLTRWRRSISSAEGQQLLDVGLGQVGYAPKPDGWTDDRYRAVLGAIAAAQGGDESPAALVAIADALIVAPQTFTIEEQLPGTILFTFLDTDANDAAAYLAALEFGRPKGERLLLEYHPDALTMFTLDASLLDGADVLGDLLVL